MITSIGAKYGGASAPPALSDRSAGGARMCNRCIEVHHWHFGIQVKGMRL